MANPYYTFPVSFVPGTKVRSDQVNSELSGIETGFDNLPSVADALTTGRAVFGTESGSGNAYVVTMPDTRTSNQDGDEVAFFATHGNTGAATLNVDGLGAVTLVDRSGSALIAGDIVSGILYKATYDATNTRFVLDVTANVVTNIVDKAQGTSTDLPSAPGTFNAQLEYVNANDVSLGYAGFNTGVNFNIVNRVYGGNVIVIATDAGGVERTAINIDPDGVMNLAYPADETIRLQIQADSVSLRSVGNTDTESRRLVFEHQDGTDRGEIGYITSDLLQLTNRIHGGSILLSAEDSVGTGRTILTADPDAATTLRGDTDLNLQVNAGESALVATSGGAVDLYYNNVKRLSTWSAGVVNLYSEGSTDAEVRTLNFQWQNNATRARVGYAGATSIFSIKNQIHGGLVEITSEDAGGIERIGMSYNPDGLMQLRAGTNLQLQVGDSPETAIVCTENANVSLYYNNAVAFETTAGGALVQAPTGDTATLDFYQDDGTTRNARITGGNTNLELINEVHGGAVSLAAENASGTPTSLFVGDPDTSSIVYGTTAVSLQSSVDSENMVVCTVNAGVTLYHDGAIRFETLSTGLARIRQLGNTGTAATGLEISQLDGTRQALFGHVAGLGHLYIANDINSGHVRIVADDAGGVERTVLDADPDATTVLRADTNLDLQVAAGETAILAIANGRVALYYDDVWEAGTEDNAFKVQNFFQNRTETATNLGNSAHAVNTGNGKVQGAQVYDITNGQPLWADGNGATSTWSDAAGTVVHTPTP